MAGITLSAEEIRAAPPEVRRWIEQEIGATLGFAPHEAGAGGEERAMRAPTPHLVACSIEEARGILAAIQGLLPVVAVFFELGREPAAATAQGLRAFRLADMLRHTRLQAVEQIAASLEVVNDALRELRGEADVMLGALDGQGYCFVAEATSQNVRRLWHEVVAERDLAMPQAAPAPATTGYQAPAYGSPGYRISMPGAASGGASDEGPR